jgi:hypothetical protein
MTDAPPRSQFWLSIILLLWSLAGIAAFAGQFSMSADDIAKLPQAQQDMWGHMPVWAWTAYGVAVFAALAGAIGLVMRRRWAVPFYGISLVAVLVQFSYPFIIAHGLQQLGASALIFPGLIIFMAAAALNLARRWRVAGRLQ